MNIRAKFVTSLRWIARLLAAGLAVLIVIITIGHGGPPNPFKQPTPVVLEFIGIAIAVIGLIVGWKWPGIGGVMVLAGIGVFHIIEGKLWLGWVFGLFALTGILYLLGWWTGCNQDNKNDDAIRSA